MKKLGENRKIQYTKMVIKESLFKLLEEKPLNQITVKSLCDRADINRGTFYAHYSDIYDLVEKLEEEMIEISKNLIDFDEIGKQSEQLKLYTGIFSNIKDNIDEYKIVILNPPSIRSLDNLLSDAYEYHAAAIRETNNVSENMIEYSFEFLKHGCLQVLYKWIANGLIETPEKMAQLIVGIVQNGMQSI